MHLNNTNKRVCLCCIRFSSPLRHQFKMMKDGNGYMNYEENESAIKKR